MLKLTSTEAYSLICEAIAGPTKHLPLVDIVTPEPFTKGQGSWSGYIHGIIQETIGFDIPHFISGHLPTGTGIFPCQVYLKDNSMVECFLVSWNPVNGPFDCRALIVQWNDFDGMEYACKCAKERTNDL